MIDKVCTTWTKSIWVIKQPKSALLQKVFGNEWLFGEDDRKMRASSVHRKYRGNFSTFQLWQRKRFKFSKAAGLWSKQNSIGWVTRIQIASVSATFHKQKQKANLDHWNVYATAVSPQHCGQLADNFIMHVFPLTRVFFVFLGWRENVSKPVWIQSWNSECFPKVPRHRFGSTRSLSWNYTAWSAGDANHRYGHFEHWRLSKTLGFSNWPGKRSFW